MIGRLSTLPRCSQLCHNLDHDDNLLLSRCPDDDDADHSEDGDEEEHVGGEKQEDRPDVNPLKV